MEISAPERLRPCLCLVTPLLDWMKNPAAGEKRPTAH
jgi:hypothetical protein